MLPRCYRGPRQLPRCYWGPTMQPQGALSRAGSDGPFSAMWTRLSGIRHSWQCPCGAASIPRAGDTSSLSVSSRTLSGASQRRMSSGRVRGQIRRQHRCSWGRCPAGSGSPLPGPQRWPEPWETPGCSFKPRSTQLPPSGGSSGSAGADITFQFAGLIHLCRGRGCHFCIHFLFKDGTNFPWPSAKPYENVISPSARQRGPADSIAFVDDKAEGK